MVLRRAHGKERSLCISRWLSMPEAVCSPAQDQYPLLLLHPTSWEAHPWQPVGVSRWVAMWLCGLCAWFSPICSAPVRRCHVMTRILSFFLPCSNPQNLNSTQCVLFQTWLSQWQLNERDLSSLSCFSPSIPLTLTPPMWAHFNKWYGLHSPSLACWDLEILDSPDMYFHSWTCLSQTVVSCFTGCLFSYSEMCFLLTTPSILCLLFIQCRRLPI